MLSVSVTATATITVTWGSCQNPHPCQSVACYGLISRITRLLRPFIFGTLFVVVILNWLWPLPLTLPVKLAAVVLIVMAALYHQWCRLSSGSVFTPEMPRPLIILFNWAFGALMFVTLGQLLFDTVAALIALVQWHGIVIGTAPRVGVGVVAAFLSALGVWNAIRVPPVRHETVFIPGLAPVFDGYRITQLTDLHITRLFPRRWAEEVVARTNAIGADLIVVTGDFIDGSVAMRRDDVAPLSQLKAPDGVIACPGNHEYFFDYREWMQHLATLGFHMLLNTHCVITRAGASLVVAGVTDRSAGRHGEARPDLAAALAGRPADAPVILLDHQPGEARQAAERGVSLQLSGHTHGGMLYGLDRMVARGNNGFVSRRYEIGAMTLYVGNGTGIWPGFALRLGRPSEITCFHLKAA